MLFFDFNPRLQVLFLCLGCGSKWLWKYSFFVKNVLEHCQRLLSVVPDNIIWIHTSFQPMYAELQKKNKNITFVEGLTDSYEDENLIPLITPIKIT